MARGYARLICFAAIVGPLFVAGLAPAAVPTSRPAAELPASAAIVARMEHLQRFSTTFAFTERFHHDPGATTMRFNGGTIRPSPDRDGVMRVQLFDGRAIWETILSPASAKQTGILRDVVVFNGDRTEILDERVGNPTVGMILGTGQSRSSLIEVGLGLRIFDFPGPAPISQKSNPWLKREQINAMTGWTDNAGNVMLEWNAANQLTYRLQFDPAMGFAMTHCTAATTDHSSRFTEIACGDFRKIGDWMIPFSVQAVDFRPRDGAILQETTAIVRNFSLDDPQNTPDAYAMRWPKGLEVTDARNGAEITVPADGFVISDANSSRTATGQSLLRAVARPIVAAARMQGAAVITPAFENHSGRGVWLLHCRRAVVWGNRGPPDPAASPAS